MVFVAEHHHGPKSFVHTTGPIGPGAITVIANSIMANTIDVVHLSDIDPQGLGSLLHAAANSDTLVDLRLNISGTDPSEMLRTHIPAFTNRKTPITIVIEGVAVNQQDDTDTDLGLIIATVINSIPRLGLTLFNMEGVPIEPPRKLTNTFGPHMDAFFREVALHH